MKLSDRLDNVLAGYGLQAECEPPIEERPVVEEKEFEPELVKMATFDNIKGMIKGADGILPDEDGIRIVQVRKIEMEDINLPMVQGKYIIDDIQKHKDGYEVHLVENPLHKR